MADLVERAKELEKEGKLHEALTYYEVAVEEKSGSFDIRSNQGTVLNRLKQYDEAYYCFNYVLSNMDENHFDSLFGRGISSLGLNKWDEALDNFSKCKDLNDKNANIWYYLSVLHKDKGHKTEYENYYKKFKELDNENFSQIRSFYEFGINFKENEIELINEFGEDFEKTDRYLNINSCIDFFKKTGLNDEEISFNINTVPIDELEKIINESCLSYNNNLEMEIIINELINMGFDEEEIESFIKNQEIEDLKSLIINNSEIDPFNKIDRVVLPNLYDMFRAIPINHAYEYKIPSLNINIEDEEIDSRSSKLKIFFNLYDKSKEKEFINSQFFKLSEKILSNDIVEIKNLLDVIESSNINEFDDLKIKLDYYKVLINYYCNHNIQFLEIYEPLEQICQSVPSIFSNPIYIYIKSSILYDTHRFEEVIDNLKSIDLTKDSQLNNDFIYCLLSSAYYKIDDFSNAYKEYKKISSENLNPSTLEYLSKLDGS